MVVHTIIRKATDRPAERAGRWRVHVVWAQLAGLAAIVIALPLARRSRLQRLRLGRLPDRQAVPERPRLHRRARRRLRPRPLARLCLHCHRQARLAGAARSLPGERGAHAAADQPQRRTAKRTWLARSAHEPRRGLVPQALSLGTVNWPCGSAMILGSLPRSARWRRRSASTVAETSSQ